MLLTVSCKLNGDDDDDDDDDQPTNMACAFYYDSGGDSGYRCIDYSAGNFTAAQVASNCSTQNTGETLASCPTSYKNYASTGLCSYTDTGDSLTQRNYVITASGHSESGICTVQFSGTFTAD